MEGKGSTRVGICHESKRAGEVEGKKLFSYLTSFFSAEKTFFLFLSLGIRLLGKEIGKSFLCGNNECGKVSLDGIFCVPSCVYIVCSNYNL